MMKPSRNILLLVMLFAILLSSCQQNNSQKQKEAIPEILLIPQPAKVLYRAGTVILGKGIWIVTDVSDETSAALATYLKEHLAEAGAKDIYIGDIYSTRKHKQAINLILDKTYGDTEAYTLELTSAQIKLTASTARGMFYGIQTFLQIMESTHTNSKFVIPKMVIKDQPVYHIRGVKSDMPADESTSKSLLKSMAKLKLNTLVIGNDELDPANEIYTLAKKDFIRVITKKEVPENIVHVSLPIDVRQLPDTSPGFLLKIDSLNDAELQKGLNSIAGLAWSGRLQ